MGVILQEELPRHQYRYSIQQLLQLSATINAVFDLSRFTYDAAREGVVPLLSGCIVTSRKTSANEPQEFSAGSSSGEDIMVFQGNLPQRPRRPPANPPSTFEAQKDDGFIRFLKKHSSPTHQRVNAGGRIVPIEPSSVPPTFSIPNTTQKQPPFYNIHSPEPQASKRDDIGVNTAVGMYDYGLNWFENLVRTPEVESSKSYDVNTNDLSLQVQAPEEMNQLQSPFFCNSLSCPLTAPVLPAYSNPMNLQGQLYGTCCANQLGCHGTQNRHHNNSDNVVQTYSNLCSGTRSCNDWTSSGITSQELIERQYLSAQQSLLYWQQQYSELDQQLKSIDRHRAMSNLDPHLVQQRRVIVQQRSDVKDLMDNIRTVLGFDRSSDASQGSGPTSFNVEAPVYIPLNQSKTVYCSSASHDTSITADKAKTLNKVRSSTASKAIPIIAPSSTNEKAADQQHSHHFPSSTTDEWGVRLGDAPPSMKKEQSSLSDKLQLEVNEMTGKENTSQISVTSNLSSGLPSHIKDGYERLLDAMRQPKGIITEVQIGEQWMNIKGQGLRMRPSVSMEEWEQDYWLRQYQDEDDPPKHMKVPRNDDGRADKSMKPYRSDKENMSTLPHNHQKAATDSVGVHTNNTDPFKASSYKLAMRSPSFPDDIAQNPDHAILRDLYNTSLDAEPCPSTSQSMQNWASSGSPLEALPSQLGSQDLYKAPIEDEQAHLKDLNTKGYSSVSIQPVHALGQMPNLFDGSTEATREARSALAVAQRATKSPRLFHRSTVNGHVWYGPFCREANSGDLISNDAVTSSTHCFK